MLNRLAALAIFISLLVGTRSQAAHASPIDDIRQFNGSVTKAAKRQETWPSSATAVAVHFVGPHSGAGHRTVSTTTNAGRSTTVLITDTGLEDDSLEARRLSIKLTRTGRYWRIVEVDPTWRCQPGRGHRTFSKEACH